MYKISYNSHRSNTLVGKTIRFCTAGRFSHSSTNINGVIYESQMFKGTIKTDEKDWDDSTVIETDTFEISAFKYRQLKTWVDGEVGKGYDWLGVLSFLWIYLKPIMGRWFCSEIMATLFFKMADIKGYNNRLNPQQIRDIISYYKQTICKINTQDY